MRLTSPFRGFKKIQQTPVAWLLLGLSGLSNAAQWIYLASRVHPESQPIPLHYTTTFGIDRIGPWYAAFLLSLSGTAILISNIALSAMTIEHQRVTGILVTAVTLLAELLLLTGAVLTFSQL